jgi:hypothetical protein
MRRLFIIAVIAIAVTLITSCGSNNKSILHYDGSHTDPNAGSMVIKRCNNETTCSTHKHIEVEGVNYIILIIQ